MNRSCAVAVLLLTLSACRLPPDRVPLRPLPEEGQLFSYDEIISRARAQVTVALEAFYLDKWVEMEDAARGLEQSARFLPKTVEQPAKFKDFLVKEADVLRKEAIALHTAAKAKDVKGAIASFERINIKIRQLRPEPPVPAPPGKEKPKTMDEKKPAK